MRQKKTKDNTAFLYLRISRDDNLEGESYSVGNQKKLLTAVAKEKGYTNLIIYTDDGISGVTMNRPGFQDMIANIDKASAVFVKDLSRLGRNYIEVGKLTEEFFPDHDIRLVAVSDGIDTTEGENELAPIRNLFNEWYARDISKKKRISNKIRGGAGEPMCLPPYGYQKDPDNPKHWIVEPEAASIVRLIFTRNLEGQGTMQIAKELQLAKVLTPYFYWMEKGIKKARKNNTQDNPYAWQSTTITKMLHRQEYCGDIVNFKTYSKSYKNKARLENNEENMAVFSNIHEPIIDRTTFEKIQKTVSKRKKPTLTGERNIFSGLLVCADCGGNLHFHFNQKNHDIKFFSCSNYNKAVRTCDSTHYIRADFLEQVVLAELKRLAKFVTQYEDIFLQAVQGYAQAVAQETMKRDETEYKALKSRTNELDTLFERLYEDNVSGKISDERFRKMSDRYETEQGEITAKLQTLKQQLDTQKAKTVTTDDFRKSVTKLTRIRKLTPLMVNELIEKIEVHQSTKENGIQTQRLTIHYHCIGPITIPDNLPLPDITMDIRKGVRVAYHP